MYNKLSGYHARVVYTLGGTYDDEQNTCLASVMVVLGGAYHNGSNEIEISLDFDGKSGGTIYFKIVDCCWIMIFNSNSTIN